LKSLNKVVFGEFI